MVEGRLNKYFEECVLLEQRFIADDSVKVKDVVDRKVSKGHHDESKQSRCPFVLAVVKYLLYCLPIRERKIEQACCDPAHLKRKVAPIQMACNVTTCLLIFRRGLHAPAMPPPTVA
eukprot:1147473-Pelagomonas_calceolata.AAC.1